MTRSLLLISTLDTKADETLYLRRKIEEHGVNVLLMDISMGAGCDAPCEIPADHVAQACGWTMQDIRASRERARITAAMIKGAIDIAADLFANDKVHGFVGLGGSTGSLMATDVMRAMPFGPPKLMVSSTAALPGMATRYIDTGDLMLFHSVVEIAGLSPPLRSVLDRAAAAAAAMTLIPTLRPEEARQEGRGLVAMSMFGPCEKCARAVRAKLEEAGFAVIGFSAAGVCDRAMEDLIAQGYFCGVVDLAPGGVGECVMEGMRAAGPNRLESAGRLGLPQVIAPSGVNLMSPRKSRYKPDYHQRRKYDLDKLRTFLRLAPEELELVAAEFIRKLNLARGPVRVLIPTRGWCSFDCEGGQVYAPDEDRVFTDTLRAGVNPGVEVVEVDANLEDENFASAVAESFVSLAC